MALERLLVLISLLFRPSCRKTEPSPQGLGSAQDLCGAPFLHWCSWWGPGHCLWEPHRALGWLEAVPKTTVVSLVSYYLLKYFASNCPAFLGKNTRLKKKILYLHESCLLQFSTHKTVAEDQRWHEGIIWAGIGWLLMAMFSSAGYSC